MTARIVSITSTGGDPASGEPEHHQPSEAAAERQFGRRTWRTPTCRHARTISSSIHTMVVFPSGDSSRRSGRTAEPVVRTSCGARCGHSVHRAQGCAREQRRRPPGAAGVRAAGPVAAGAGGVRVRGVLLGLAHRSARGCPDAVRGRRAGGRARTGGGGRGRAALHRSRPAGLRRGRRGQHGHGLRRGDGPGPRPLLAPRTRPDRGGVRGRRRRRTARRGVHPGVRRHARPRRCAPWCQCGRRPGSWWGWSRSASPSSGWRVGRRAGWPGWRCSPVRSSAPGRWGRG